MLRQQNPSGIDPNQDGTNIQGESAQSGAGSIDIQRELNRLEEMILDSPRIPLTRRTLVDEEQLLDQLDLVRMNLPAAFAEAEEIARHKDEILIQAEKYAQEIIEAAERQVAQILDEMGIVRQAKIEADQIRQQVQEECQAAQEQTIAEIERLQDQAQQEIEEMRRRALAECEAIENGADDYADRVLDNIEQQLGDMLRVIRNGRSELQQESAAAARDRQNRAKPQSSHASQPPKGSGRSKH